MNLIYNTQEDFATSLKHFLHISSLKHFLHISCPFLHKPALNIIPYIIYGMINSESSVSSDISKHLKGDFSLVQLDSVSRRIRRFFNNPNFDPFLFYESIIKFVISSLFNDKNYNLIFLADRFFNSSKVMKHIDSLSHTFCFRLKSHI